MLFYLQSTNPENYGTVKFYANPPLGKDPLLFRINQVNTIAAFMVTTVEDYIEFNIGGELKRVYLTKMIYLTSSLSLLQVLVLQLLIITLTRSLYHPQNRFPLLIVHIVLSCY